MRLYSSERDGRGFGNENDARNYLKLCRTD